MEEVSVGDTTRTSKVFIPEGAPIRSYFTVISVPDGWKTEDFLVKSGWMDIASERKEGLFVLEPDQSTGKWGSVDAEGEYITAALKVMEERKFYSTHGVHYMAGYGSGGTALQNYVANNPLSVISTVFIDTEDLNNLEEIGAQQFTFSPKFSETGLDSRFTSVSYNEVPLPVWFVNQKASNISNLLSYWKGANDVVQPERNGNGVGNQKGVLESNRNGGFGEVYSQREDSNRITTWYSDPVSKVALLEKKVRYEDKQFTRQVYQFLSYYTRYDNTTVFGNVLGVRPNYEKLGIDIKNMTVIESDGQVWNREYMVYVPKNSNKIYPEGAPAVYVFPGGSQPNRLFFDATRWWEIADKYGFIIVVPCSQYSANPDTPLETRWNYLNTDLDKRADDFEFVKKLIAQVDSDYNTDPNRRYAAGHSNGFMFGNAIGYRMPEYFTAIAGSGATSNPISDSASSVLPIHVNWGENDNSSYNLSQPGNLRNVVSYWLDRNGLGHIDAPTDVEYGIGMLQRTTMYSWANEQDIPLVQYSVTAARNHNVSVDSLWTFWEEWFSKWTKDKEGNLYYEGQLVK